MLAMTLTTECDRCGHPRSDHGYCSPDYPSVCTHLEQPDAPDAYCGVCACLEFEEPTE